MIALTEEIEVIDVDFFLRGPSHYVELGRKIIRRGKW